MGPVSLPMSKSTLEMYETSSSKESLGASKAYSEFSHIHSAFSFSSWLPQMIVTSFLRVLQTSATSSLGYIFDCHEAPMTKAII